MSKFPFGAALALAGGLVASVRAQPRIPLEADGIPPPRLGVPALSIHPEAVTPAPTALSVTLTNRIQVRAFYNAVYSASENAPNGWTGSLSGTPGSSATGSAGTTSDALKAAVQLRINWFRAMAGVPGTIGMDSVESAEDQDAALIMAANNQLNHTPPNSWLLYTSDGAAAAAQSNLNLGSFGPDAISDYMIDFGSNNYAVGHRRWILYPETQTMATGDIPATNGFSSANATWVIDSNPAKTRPAVRDNFVAWPSPGFIPYPVMPQRWSFSYPGADFSATTVTMTSNGNPVAVQLEMLDNPAYGENTLVWDPTLAPQTSSDLTYQVNVNGVKINGSPQNFSYAVTLFDPAVAGPGDAPPTVSGPAAPPVGQGTSYTVAGLPSFATGFAYRSLSLSPFSTVFGAEGGLQGVVAGTSSGYNPVDTSTAASGGASYHLAMPDLSNQTLTLPGEYEVPNAPATVVFASRLGWASNAQTARVQVSIDDGAGWTDLYTQTGTNSQGETSFTTRSIDLSGYAGLVIMVRFAYTYDESTSGYPQTTTGIGWNIDNIALNGVQSAAASSPSPSQTGNSFTFAAPSTAAVGLQAEAILFGQYPLSWGPVLAVNPAQMAPSITSQPASQTVTPGSTVVFRVSATGGPAPTYQWSLNGMPISGATSAQLLVSDAGSDNAGSYTVTATNSSGTVTSSSATLTVSASSNPGQLVNLSILSRIAGSLTMGFVNGGAGTSGSEPLLIRAIGPSVGPGTLFNVPGVMPDPSLKVVQQSNSAVAASNAGWGSNSAAVTAADNATGAFPLTNPSSLDSALVVSLTPVGGGYGAQVSGTSGDSGFALTEVYDDTSTYTAASPRLINLSCLTTIAAGGNLNVGFVLGGTTSKTVLVRVSGPSIAVAPFNVGGTMPDPQLTLAAASNSSVSLASNAGWGGDATIASTAASLGAFPFASATSKDSAVLLTVPPVNGGYSVTVSSASGAGGAVLVEVYEVP